MSHFESTSLFALLLVFQILTILVDLSAQSVFLVCWTVFKKLQRFWYWFPLLVDLSFKKERVTALGVGGRGTLVALQTI